VIRKCNPTDPSQYAEYDYVTPWEEDEGTILTINDNSITGDTIIHLEGGSYKRMSSNANILKICSHQIIQKKQANCIY
jgi:hypothetical protein